MSKYAHVLQTFKSKTHFVFVETMFGVSNPQYIAPIDEFNHAWRCNALKDNPNVLVLPVVFVSNSELKRQSKVS